MQIFDLVALLLDSLIALVPCLVLFAWSLRHSTRCLREAHLDLRASRPLGATDSTIGCISIHGLHARRATTASEPDESNAGLARSPSRLGSSASGYYCEPERRKWLPLGEKALQHTVACDVKRGF
ncbi:hypothetical protein EDB83DRAFT_2357794 [Lactarius deliciosus]|nr:hypothetical protein EDB83DRAFT_2357794 [Lactarius deliciosus]